LKPHEETLAWQENWRLVGLTVYHPLNASLRQPGRSLTVPAFTLMTK
jgi:hypothetical protein